VENYSSGERLIDLRAYDGRLIDRLTLSQIEANAGFYDLKRNKRGHIQGARVKSRMSFAPLSNDGIGFEQTLPNGRVVFALKGTTGSDRKPMVIFDGDLATC
jgi:hypothetical protein